MPQRWRSPTACRGACSRPFSALDAHHGSRGKRATLAHFPIASLRLPGRTMRSASGPRLRTIGTRLINHARRAPCVLRPGLGRRLDPMSVRQRETREEKKSRSSAFVADINRGSPGLRRAERAAETIHATSLCWPRIFGTRLEEIAWRPTPGLLLPPFHSDGAVRRRNRPASAIRTHRPRLCENRKQRPRSGIELRC